METLNEDGANNEEKSISKKVRNIMIAVAIVIVIVPIALNLAFYLSIPTPIPLGNSEWLAFWGNYSGGVIGGIAALVTIYFTIQYYEKQDENHKKELVMQRKQYETQIHKQELKEYTPYIFVNIDSYGGTCPEVANVQISIKNISKYPIRFIQVEMQLINILMPNETKSIILKDGDNTKTKNKNGFYNEISICIENIIGTKYDCFYELREIPNETSSEKCSRFYVTKKEKIIEKTNN